MKLIIEVPVDIHNEFTYDSNTYKISPTLKQYEVQNYPLKENGKYNNWTNTSEMDSVITIDKDGILMFVDQNGSDITEFVSIV
jgi:hypothetical protein